MDNVNKKVRLKRMNATMMESFQLRKQEERKKKGISSHIR